MFLAANQRLKSTTNTSVDRLHQAALVLKVLLYCLVPQIIRMRTLLPPSNRVDLPINIEVAYLRFKCNIKLYL